MEAEVLHKKKTLAPKLRFKGFDGNWETKHVIDIASKLNVGFVGTCEPYYTSSEEGILLVRTGNLKGVKIILEDEKYVTKEFNDKNKKSQIFPGDLLLARHGGNGEICMVPKDFPTANSLNIVILRTTSEIDGTYFQLSYSTFSVQKQISSVTAGSTQGVINTSEIGKLKIHFPTLPEQQKIASFLSAVDEKIQHLTRKKELLEQYKKGVMQQLFSGRLRFKDENGKTFPKWQEKRLGEICNITTGKLDANAMIEGGKYRFYTCAKDYFQIDDFAFDTDALLISGNGANVGYIHHYKGKFNAYQRTYVLDGFIDNIFYLKHFLDQHLYKRIFKEKKEGNTPYIVMGTLSEMRVALPDVKEQKKIANYLSSIDNKIESVNKQITQSQTFKKGLLQQMFV